MAAMAPALTDTPAETCHIRFRLAPPTPTISPGSMESDSNGGSLLAATAAGPGRADAVATPLAKLQPLVASYLYSDAKESLKLQGVLRPGGILGNSYFGSGGFLTRKHGTLEISGEQLMDMRCGATESASRKHANGLSKRPVKPNLLVVNGGGPSASPKLPPSSVLEANESAACSPLTSAVHKPGGVSSESPSQQELVCGPTTWAELRDRSRQSRNRQSELEGRLCRLRKRLRVVQAKQTERHVRQQLGGFLQSAVGGHRPSRLLRSDSVCSELQRFVLNSSSSLRTVESAFDSDATESSSGGETDVEEDELARADVEQRHIPLWRRAEGRYATERADVISHWNWLQAQISELEYRIRQQSDVCRQLRASKGAVLLGKPAGVEVKSEPAHALDIQDLASEGPVSPGVGLWQSCSAVKHLNGVLDSVQLEQPGSGSLESRDAEELLPAAADSSCVSARTRPLLNIRKRQLVRPSPERKGLPGTCCSVNPLCTTCEGRLAHYPQFQYQRPLLQRLAQFDPCVHPILSFTGDVSLNLHLQRLMKCHWQSSPLQKVRPLKRLSLKPRLSPGTPSSGSYRDSRRLSSSCSPAARLHKVRLEKPQQLDRLSYRTERTSSYMVGVHERSSSRKRTREASLEKPEVSPRLQLDTSVSSTYTNAHTHGLFIRQPSAPCDGLPALSTPPTRRRRGESSFDINNIVIPMSVAATTRVEKLQYKEILTPSWREVDVCAQPIAPEDDAEEVEDLSDVAFAQLHQPCEEHERSRWSWAASAAAKRRGSRSYRSVDGRSTPLPGTNPPSPDTLHDYSCLGSPCSPLSPHDCQQPQYSEDTCSSTTDCTTEALPVQPWERRDFPLDSDPCQEPEEQYEGLCHTSCQSQFESGSSPLRLRFTHP